MPYQPHEQRVIKELEELTAKIDALEKFIDSSQIYKSLPDTDRSLLCGQFGAMTDYAGYLHARIERFKD